MFGHAQLWRDCLVTNDDILKVVDFGVSEMFEKDSNMFTGKSAGSPGTARRCSASQRAAFHIGDSIELLPWTRYLSPFRIRLPFEKQSIFELYDSIRGDTLVYEDESDEVFKDLIFVHQGISPDTIVQLEDALLLKGQPSISETV
jgi:[calcium/calmodulin-dependent protein kinase] kinase